MSINMIGDRIQGLLYKNNMAQKELAITVGTSEVNVSRYIAGSRIPKGPVLVNIAKALNTTPEYILGMEEFHMSGTEYQKLAMRTANEKCRCLQNAGLGLGGEAGEAMDIIKKHLYHGHKLDYIALVKELGDVLWYVALICELIGADMSSVMAMNIDKLRARYPEGFSEYNSQHRREGDI